MYNSLEMYNFLSRMFFGSQADYIRYIQQWRAHARLSGHDYPQFNNFDTITCPDGIVIYTHPDFILKRNPL